MKRRCLGRRVRHLRRVPRLATSTNLHFPRKPPSSVALVSYCTRGAWLQAPIFLLGETRFSAARQLYPTAHLGARLGVGKVIGL